MFNRLIPVTNRTVKQITYSAGELTCEICIEPIVTKFQNGNICSHPFCTDCTIQYIRVSLENGNTAGNILCPAVDCGHKLDPHAWASIIGPTLFVRWCDVLAEAALLELDKCYCPNLSCSHLILNECRGNPKKSKCLSCKTLFCFRCKRDWHEGSRCGEQDVDVQVRNLAGTHNWKTCPACKHLVERNGGCSTIRCRCGIRFCYTCGKKCSYLPGSCGCPVYRAELIIILVIALLLLMVLFGVLVLIFYGLYSAILLIATLISKLGRLIL